MASRSERIEEIFQRVEEESQRRAQAAKASAQSSVSFTPSASAATSCSTPRERRRGSVSISRFGQPADPSMESISSSAVPSRKPSMILQRQGFYQVQTHSSAQGSADSLESETDDHQADHIIDEEHVTQMATIAGRQSISKSVGGMISRRLSRSRTQSRDVLGARDLFSDVSVEVTVEAEEHDPAQPVADTKAIPGSTSVVFSPTALHHRRSRLSISEKGTSNGWVTKAKDLTQKLRRKSIATLTQSPIPR